MSRPALLAPAALIDLNGPEKYVHWGWFQISAGNLVMIVAMILVFILAVVLPFPGRGRR